METIDKLILFVASMAACFTVIWNILTSIEVSKFSIFSTKQMLICYTQIWLLPLIGCWLCNQKMDIKLTKADNESGVNDIPGWLGTGKSTNSCNDCDAGIDE
ncbi:MULTISPECIES: hypothetical protein [unclassified Oleiphilus]|uniref:hypothetical protein n=1 Tax=unclassified Oleiphilus TaxID=2631174 RepID=UPI0007C3F93C|nr:MULTISPECIES: hypothetical protein [unclassified Oleiphilus]KZY66789.1 hypothetical protein A3738_16330 [Oleiphilus sp. HI0066]KZY69196.1 hypothetical protein A3739_09495 [Oleiphilus sp. HI0067]KZY73771.1 hypothetical protein A3739_25970 [Oleiphilus sp. HI0067]KZZ59799.1 hypothetical protein A3762_16295 [Oleiphilus sp. HI0125]KZZ61537.1 hypothetical protein A3762_24505 [Oleiphilus sp. HI0125]